MPENKRLDALSKNGVATEIERGGTSISIEKAIKRLKDSKAPIKKLKVPHKDVPLAVDIAEKKEHK